MRLDHFNVSGIKTASCISSCIGKLFCSILNQRLLKHVDLRWLHWIFLRGYLPSLSINYVGMSEDVEKKLPQLYYIKMKISYDLGFSAIGVAMAT